MTLFNQF
jgi:hypoxia up-regulated 1